MEEAICKRYGGICSCPTDLLTLLWHHEKIYVSRPWGQYDPITKNALKHKKN